MTEPVTAAITSPTALSALLATATQTPSASLGPYRGVLTPRLLDANEREMAALVTGVAVHDLGWMHRVAVRGEDRFRWLSGMVSNTVNELGANAGAWNLVLNVQGRILGELHVWREGSGSEEDALELEIAADQEQKLLTHLEKFIIMDDVELIRLSPEANGPIALGLTGPLADDLLTRLGLPSLPEPLTSLQAEWNGRAVQIMRGYGVLVPHYELWTDAKEMAALWTALLEAGATPVGTDSLESLRIAEGIPAYGVDIAEKDLPQETSQLRALHFAKGCYLGQEIVERIHARGNVHRHLRHLELDGPLPEVGTELKFQNATGTEAAAGTISSATELILSGGNRRFALGMIRAEAELRNQPFTYTAGAEVRGSARILTALSL